MCNYSGINSLTSGPLLTVVYQVVSTLLNNLSDGPNTPFCSFITNSGSFLIKKYTTYLNDNNVLLKLEIYPGVE